jgi:flagellar biosynthesis/type III secretory pathway M-ring protein FliF/YscJ
MPFDVLALRRQREEHYARKITEHLGYIPGVLVGVHAELNLEKKSVQDLKLGKPVVSEEENNSTSSSRGAAGAGPGVKPNVGRAVSGGGGEESMSREDSRSKFDGRRDETVTQIVLMPGDVRRLTASINVPRSYFVGVYRQVNPRKDEPKDADLTPIITAETKKIRGQVRSLIAASSDDQVDVDWFYDTAVATSGPGGGPAAAAMSGAGAGGYFGPAWDYAPQAGLALLALMSLAVVLRMARRSQAAIVAAGQAMERRVRVEQEAVAARLEKLDTNVDVAGEAASTEMVLEGHELAEDEVRVQHLVDQIGQMVKDDSNTAASLVEQWVGASRL